jgi:hypothetical protein
MTVATTMVGGTLVDISAANIPIACVTRGTVVTRVVSGQVVTSGEADVGVLSAFIDIITNLMRIAIIAFRTRGTVEAGNQIDTRGHGSTVVGTSGAFVDISAAIDDVRISGVASRAVGASVATGVVVARGQRRTAAVVGGTFVDIRATILAVARTSVANGATRAVERTDVVEAEISAPAREVGAFVDIAANSGTRTRETRRTVSTLEGTGKVSTGSTSIAATIVGSSTFVDVRTRASASLVTRRARIARESSHTVVADSKRATTTVID